MILLIALVACEEATSEPTPDVEATGQAAIARAAPTETPPPTADNQATVQARVQATVEALHTPVPTVTVTPTRTSSPTTATVEALHTPVPTVTVTPMRTPSPTTATAEALHTPVATVTITPTQTPSPTTATTNSLTFKHRSFDIHFEVRALKVERGYQDDSNTNFWPDSGNEWVRVSLEVKNLADARSLTVERNNFAIVDENTSELGSTFGAPKPIEFLPAKVIPPGSTRSGNIVLQTPVSASHLLLEFEPIFFDAQYLPLTPGTRTPTVTPTPISTGTPEAPASPSNVRVFVEGLTMKVSWDPVAGATHYKTYHDDLFVSDCSLRSGSPSFCEELAGNIVGTSYIHTTPGEADNYYWVVACNGVGCSEINSESPASVRPPRRPIITVVNRDASTLTIKWYTPGANPERYELLRRLPQDDMYSQLDSNLSGFTYIDKGLEQSTTYYYRLRGCNHNGCSSFSEAGGVTESAGPVAVPSNPTGVLGTKISDLLRTDEARVIWNPVEGATYYEVFQGSHIIPARGPRLDARVSAPKTSYYDNSPNHFLGAFQTTSYKVRACNKTGCSPFSASVWIH